MARFVRIHNKVVNTDNIAYVDFLDSGRAMVFMSGLTQEKQNIPVEPDEARILRAFFDAELGPETSRAHAQLPPPSPRPLPLPSAAGHSGFYRP